MLGKDSTTELHPYPFSFVDHFKTTSCEVAKLPRLDLNLPHSNIVILGARDVCQWQTAFLA